MKKKSHEMNGLMSTWYRFLGIFMALAFFIGSLSTAGFTGTEAEAKPAYRTSEDDMDEESVEDYDEDDYADDDEDEEDYEEEDYDDYEDEGLDDYGEYEEDYDTLDFDDDGDNGDYDDYDDSEEEDYDDSEEEGNDDSDDKKSSSYSVKPNQIVVKSVKNISKTSAKLVWKKDSYAAKYQVNYALNSKFSKSAKKVTTKKTTYTVKGLKKGKTYYFRVRGISGKKSGSWSSVEEVYIAGGSNTIRLTPKKNLASVQEALDQALKNKKKKYIITVPKGTYKLEKSLQIYSNTTLILKGVTIKRTYAMKTMLLFGSGNGGKYSMGKNITVKGGTLDGGTIPDKPDICCFSHIQNITFDGITFKYLPKKKVKEGQRNTHMIEFAGSKNVTIRNCKFYNNKNCRSNNEAVQLESLYPDQAATTPQAFGKRDGTQSSNVTIEKCYFKNWGFGCGSNHLSKKDHPKNMKFLNNTFENVRNYAICLFGYRNVTVKGNKLVKSSARLVQNLNSTGVKISK